MNRFLRYLWAGPTTLIGVGLAVASLRRGHVAIVDGVIEAHSPFLHRALASLTPLAAGVDAMTLGHVVIGGTRVSWRSRARTSACTCGNMRCGDR